MELVVGMLTKALEHNAELAWRLEAAKKLLGKKKSERNSEAVVVTKPCIYLR